ncbi:TIGR03545 family protein [Mariniblastus sp.]|jgi:uncharacterized protein (TIGR03545 family)|nr:TIGR03545 family protein [Mariniblastus sp.]MDB4755920.1 TIGR03545 family protein [Mariniblastus sp.]
MIKWKYVMVRLAILVLFLTTIHYGSGPVLSWALTSTTEWLTGSKLEIDQLKASPFQTHLTVGRVALTSPGNPMENLLEFSNGHLRLDRNALFRKKVIITEGRLNEIRLGATRQVPSEVGEIPAPKPVESRLLNDRLEGMGEKIVGGMTSFLTKRFDENFETVRFSKEMMDRWRGEYQVLMGQAKKAEQRVREIRNLSLALRENPLNTLRDLPRIEQAVRDSQTIKVDLNQIKQALRRHRVQMAKDRGEIVSTKNRDLQRIREIQVSGKLNGQTLSQLMVGKIHGRRVDQAIGWIRWLRTHFPHPEKSLETLRDRGQTIRFPGIIEEPDFLVRNLSLGGYAEIDERSFEFTGALVGLTTQPRRYGKPTYLHLQSTGDIGFNLKGMVDRTGDINRDRIIFHIPALQIAEQTVDVDQRVGLRIGKTRLEIRGRIELAGEQLTGKVTTVQTGVSMEMLSALDGRMASDFIGTVNGELASLRKFETTAHLSGSLDRPSWKLSSDLGPQLAEVFNGTLAEVYASKKNLLRSKLNHQTEEVISELGNLLQAKETLLVEFLQTHGQEVLQLNERIGALMERTGLRFR